MKLLIPLLKEIELNLRANIQFNKELYTQLSQLSDWEYRIIQDFILKVNLYIKNNNYNFVYKIYEQNMEFPNYKYDQKIDLLIAILKRDKDDVILTDVYNRLPIPSNLTYDFLEVWGQTVTYGRNFAISEALKRNCKYILFIDDDIIAPQGSIIQLYNSLIESNSKVISGQYYRKTTPLMSAHGNLILIENNLYSTDMCAMGFTLIDLEFVVSNIPMPLFWEFIAPDGYWSMGEDAFFSKNFIEYTSLFPIVDTSIKLLHYDKNWKKWYGIKDNDKIYASNTIDSIDKFEQLRKPPKFPLISICIPTRQDSDIIGCNLNNMLLLRGYRNEVLRVSGMPVDDARTYLVENAIKIDSDYILFIDDDIVPPIDGICKMLTLLETNNEIGAVSGDYYLKGNPSYSVHLQLNDNGIVKELEQVNCRDIIENNWLVGFGFVIIRSEFFKQARKPWFKCHSKNIKNIEVNEDAHCTELLFINGYKVIIDKSIKCLHLDYNNKCIYSNLREIDYTKYAGFDWLKTFESRMCVNNG